MEINDFLSISIVGVGLSLGIDWLKNKYGTEGWATKAVTIVLSVIIGALYVAIRGTSYFETIISVLGASSMVYAFFLKK